MSVMKDIKNISEYKGGWFIGAFEPNILKTKDFEVAHHYYKKGAPTEKHYHKIATEYNYIVSGRCKVNGVNHFKGDFFIYLPNEVSNVQFLADTNLIIIKVPSVLGDKYLVEKEE